MNTQQLSLQFDGPPADVRIPCQRHSATSRAAAESIRHTAPTLRDRVLAWFSDRPEGATDLECIESFGTQSVRPRRIELWQQGLIRDSGRQDKTPSGRLATIWEVVR